MRRPIGVATVIVFAMTTGCQGGDDPRDTATTAPTASDAVPSPSSGQSAAAAISVFEELKASWNRQDETTQATVCDEYLWGDAEAVLDQLESSWIPEPNEFDREQVAGGLTQLCAPFAAGGTDARGAGTIDEPLPAGTPLQFTDWEVVLSPTDTDSADLYSEYAPDQITEEASGGTLVSVEVTALRVHPEPGVANEDIRLAWITGQSRTELSFDHSCSLAPDQGAGWTLLGDIGETFTAGEVSGRVCMAVPLDQVDGGVWMVEHTIDGQRYFIAQS